MTRQQRKGELTEQLLIRTTKEQKRTWRTAAARSGRRLSRWMRDVLDAVAGADDPPSKPPDVGEDQER